MPLRLQFAISPTRLKTQERSYQSIDILACVIERKRRTTRSFQYANVAVLKIPPVVSPITAVRAGIAQEFKLAEEA